MRYYRLALDRKILRIHTEAKNLPSNKFLAATGPKEVSLITPPKKWSKQMISVNYPWFRGEGPMLADWLRPAQQPASTGIAQSSLGAQSTMHGDQSRVHNKRVAIGGNSNWPDSDSNTQSPSSMIEFWSNHERCIPIRSTMERLFLSVKPCLHKHFASPDRLYIRPLRLRLPPLYPKK